MIIYVASKDLANFIKSNGQNTREFRNLSYPEAVEGEEKEKDRKKNIRWLACLLTPKGLAFLLLPAALFLITLLALGFQRALLQLYQCLLLAQDSRIKSTSETEP